MPLEIELLSVGGNMSKMKRKCLQKEISTGARTGLLKRLWQGTRAQELVEFAFVVWILLGFLILVFWVGRAYSVYQAVERAAREGARVYLASSCATCGNTAATSAAAQAAADGVLTAASLDPALATVNPSTVVLVPANLPNYSEVDGVSVQVTYPYRVRLPLLGFLSRRRGRTPTVDITSTVVMKQEY
jgi:Flp pilus assembly protein TadG